MKKLKIKNRPHRFKRTQYALYILLPLLIIAVVLTFLAFDYFHGNPKTGDYISGQAEPSAAYKNLDLSIAKTATYVSNPIKISRDLGVVGGVRQQIFNFYVAKDNLTESGLLSLPLTPAPAGGYPLIILCHGYSNPLYYSTEKAYLPDMEFYSKNGYAVLKPDYRGQGLSIGQGSPEGAYYSMAYNTDVLSLIAAAKVTKMFNKNDINLWGHSMGAYVALRASVLSPDIKNTILLSGPIGYVQDMFSSYVAISDANNAVAATIRAKQLSAHNTPMANPAFWDKTSPLNYLKDSKSFYQIHVGTADKIVPPHFSADFDTVLTKDSKPHQYYVYPGGDHGLVSLKPIIWSRSLAQLNSVKP
jgi:pimeloyl-ACP methyl ester carboxylesterase